MIGKITLLEVQGEQKTKIYLEAHGCSASFADAEILSGLISQGGYQIVDSEVEADLNLLVTCSVKSVTEQRMLSRIRELSSLKGKHLLVAGCLPKAEPAKILKINPNLSLIGPGNLDKVLPAISDTLSGRQLVATEASKLVKLGMPRSRKNDVIGIVEIASGCLSSCTFCQVKLVKGAVFSYPDTDILSEIATLIEQGSKEIWLTSTDNSAYGGDSKTNLASLLKKVCEIRGDFIVRVGMMNPLLTGRMLYDLIDSFKHEKVFKFLHLPVQSGSERILKQMRRGYGTNRFYETLNAFRAEIPELTLSTDMICGFPSETESEFQESLELLRVTQPDIVNISRFGARSGTSAALMDDQISPEISKNRSNRMTSLVKEISNKRNRRWIGWEGDILFDEIGKGALIGRNFAYKPIVVKEECFVRSKEQFIATHQIVRIVDCTSSTLRAIPI